MPEQQNPKAPDMSAKTAEALRNGTLIKPDLSNPMHQEYAEIIAELSQEFGREVSFYLHPITGKTEEERHQSRLETMSLFFAHTGLEEIYLPESADYFYTRGEIKAVLTHEFRHLEQTDTEKLKQK